MANYERLQTGMSYAEVVDILGEPGQEISRNELAGFTTVMYMLVWTPTGINGWDWLWIVLGLFLDIVQYQQAAANRKQVPGYTGP